jgi:hypothetical protein
MQEDKEYPWGGQPAPTVAKEDPRFIPQKNLREAANELLQLFITRQPYVTTCDCPCCKAARKLMLAINHVSEDTVWYP